MGKLQIRGGSGEVPQLSPREPYFDGENLHVGKLDGSGNKTIGGSSALLGDSANIVEWVQGEPKPTLIADYLTGDFVEGRQHIVNTYAVDAGIVGVISVIVENSITWSKITLSPNMDICMKSGDFLYETFFEETEPDTYEYYIRRYSLATGLLDQEFIDISVFDNIIREVITSDSYIYVYGEFTGKLNRFSVQNGEPDTVFNSLMSDAQLKDVVGIHVSDSAIFVIMTPATVFKFDLAGNEDLVFNTTIEAVLDTSDALSTFVFDDTLVLTGDFGLLKINHDGSKNASFETNLLSTSLVGIAGVAAGQILLGPDAYYVYFNGTIFRILKDGTPDEDYDVSDVNFMNYLLPDKRLLITTISDGVRLISADSNSFEEVSGGYAGRAIQLQNNLFTIIDGEMVVVYDFENSEVNVPIMQKIYLSTAGYNARDIIGLENSFLVQVYDDNSGSNQIFHFNIDGSLALGYVDYLTEVINSYSSVKILPNPVPEPMEEGTFTYIRSKGEYVLAGVPPEQPGINLRIVTENMKAGDKVKIYNSSSSGLSILPDMQILAGLNMQEISGYLQPGNFAEFMYAGHGIGLLLYSTQQKTNFFQSM